MTYNVFGGTLNIAQLTQLNSALAEASKGAESKLEGHNPPLFCNAPPVCGGTVQGGHKDAQL